MEKNARKPWAVQKQEAYKHPEGSQNTVLEAQVKCLTQT